MPPDPTGSPPATRARIPRPGTAQPLHRFLCALAEPFKGEPNRRLQRPIPPNLRLPLELVQKLPEVLDDLLRPHILQMRPHQLDGKRVHLNSLEQIDQRLPLM